MVWVTDRVELTRKKHKSGYGLTHFYFESKKLNSGQVLASYWVQYTGRTRPKPLLKIIVLQVCP